MLLLTSRPPGETGPRLVTRLLVAAGGGLVLAASFPPVGWWPLALLAVAVLALVVRGLRARAGALVGLVFGMAFLLPLLAWMQVVGVDAWLALCLLESCFYAVLGAALTVTGRVRGWPLVTAALWVAVEAARALVPFGGFPWGRLAFAQTASPLTGYAALGGAPLVTFATALVGALLAATLLALRARAQASRPRRRDLTSRFGVAAACAVAAVVVIVGSAAVPVPTTGERTVDVAVVQGDVPKAGLDFLGQRRAVLSNHVQVTEQYAQRVDTGQERRPDLVVWPENSSDLDPYTQRDAYALIDGAVQAVGAPTLVGSVIDGPDPSLAYNTGIVWSPRTGPGARYVKRHPVPFGEYVPFRDTLTPYVDRLSLIPRDFAAGERAGVLKLGSVVVGDAICFEVAYDSLMRDLPRGGAQVLVVQTNNATYGRTGQTEQQLAMSRLRAVEHGRAVLVAATSGISAVIAPDGRVVDRSAEFTPDVLTASVPLRDTLTVADRVGPVPEWVLAGVAAVVVVTAAARRRRTPVGEAAR